MGLISTGVAVGRAVYKNRTATPKQQQQISDKLYAGFLEESNSSTELLQNIDRYYESKAKKRNMIKAKIQEGENRLNLSAEQRRSTPKANQMSMGKKMGGYAVMALIPAIEQTIQGVSTINAIKSKNRTKQVQNDQFWEGAGNVASIVGFGLAGQAMIPIPGLGFVIGATIGGIYTGITHLLGIEKEKALTDIANDKARLLDMEMGAVRSTGNRGGF